MERRDFIKKTSILTGAALVGGQYMFTACKNPKADTTIAFSIKDINLLDEIGEVILPTTSTPGAKAAHVGAFMEIMVRDCYDEKDQKIFLSGLSAFKEIVKKDHSKEFFHLNDDEKNSLIVALDKEAKDNEASKTESKAATHYFTMIKQLTLLGYFTSEIGMTEALVYLEVPGKWDPDMEYKEGDRNWAI